MDPELLKGTISLLILSLLRRRPMYGYEIVKTVSEETQGELQWKEGSLYPGLHKLAGEGLVRGEWEGPVGGRRRKYYHLTAAGEKALESKLRSWERLARAIDRVLVRGGRDG